MNKLKNVVFGLVISVATLAVFITGVVGLDLYLHKKFDTIAGLNYRGYRGKVLGKKKAGEIRVGFFGGSAAMGYGLANEESISGYLQSYLPNSGRDKRFTVINLASTGETGCSNFKAAYSLFEYLEPDILVFYFNGDFIVAGMPSYYDQEYTCWRYNDPVLKNFRYYFIFPLALTEKYYLFRYGDISRGYQEDKSFLTQLRNRRLLDKEDASLKVGSKRAGEREKLKDFVQGLTGKNKIIIFVLEPLSRGKKAEAAYRKAYLRSSFSDNPSVRIIDLEDIFSEKKFSSYFYDGEHYNKEGNSLIAKELAKELSTIKID